MKPAVLCLLLLAACELEAARNYRTYEVTWTCLSPEGCERTDQVALIDRAEIINESFFVNFMSTRGELFWGRGQMMPSDTLPAGCYWLYGPPLFEMDLGPSRFCRSSEAFELELAILNRDPATHSKWLVEGRQIAP
jgi:hypothetical protein